MRIFYKTQYMENGKKNYCKREKTLDFYSKRLYNTIIVVQSGVKIH